jgi:hypothetical protein
LNQTRLAGLGGLAFGVLAFVAMIIASPPGGNYKASDVTSYLAKGHRPAVFLSVYLMVVAVIGLVLFLARLRDSIDGSRGTLFWGFSITSAAAWLVGWALVISGPAALAFSGGKLHAPDVSPQVGYLLAEAGWAVMYGAGGIFLGVALATFVIGRVNAPAWVRWSTAVAAVCGIASLAWFPFFVVYLWAIVLGGWTLLAAPDEARQTAAVQPA